MIFVGIDLGASAVKAVAIKSSGHKFYILDTHFFPLKLNVDEEKKILLRIGHLKTLSELYRNQEVRYIFCFSQNEVSALRLFFPFKERYKIEKSLSFEMEDKILFDYQKLISDFKIIQSSKDRTDVLVFSVFRKKILNMLHQLKSVGIEPSLVTCEAVAISNLFETGRVRQKKRQSILQKNHDKAEAESRKILSDVELYVKVGYEHTVVMPFLDGICHGVYSFEWGVSSCIRKLSIKYEIPLETAMEQFYEKGFVLTDKRGYTGSQIAFSSVIQEEFNHLVHKVHLLLLQLEGEYSWQCRKIIICGGGAQVRNLQVWLSSRWNIPVVRAESVHGFPSLNLRNNDEKQNNLLTALGSAVEGLKSSRLQPINFLKEEFAVKFNLAGVLPSQWKRPLLVGSCCVMLFCCYAYLREWQAEKLSSKIHYVFQQSSRQIAGLRSYQITVPKVRQFISGKKHLIKKMKLAEELVGIPSALDGMKDISIAIRKKPAWNLEIQQLDIGQRETKIYGTILKPYLKNLESNLKEIAKEGQLKPLPVLTKDSESSVPSNISAGSDSSVVSFAYSYMRSGSNQL